MNFKKTKVAVASGLMAASMVLAPLAAYAEEVANFNKITSTEGVPVEKKVKVASGITLPASKGSSTTDFNFTATYKASTTGKAANGKESETFTLKLSEFVNEEGKLKKDGAIAAADNFKNAVPGEYVYSLKEDEKTDLDNDGYGWTNSTKEYVLRVYVTNEESVTYTVLEANASDADNEKYALDVTSQNANKLEKASFENTYTKRGGSNVDGNPSLVIDKKVVGEYGDLNQYFKFTVKFDTPDTENRTDTQKKFTMTFTNNGNGYDGAADGEYSTTTEEDAVTLTDGGSYVFYLKSGASVSFDDLPAGTTYTLSEKKETGYTATVSAKENGKENSSVNTTDSGTDVTTGSLKIGEKENTATVTNTYRNITITGVVTHSAPFVIMVGALFVAVGGYVVLKKRIEE